MRILLLLAIVFLTGCSECQFANAAAVCQIAVALFAFVVLASFWRNP